MFATIIRCSSVCLEFQWLVEEGTFRIFSLHWLSSFAAFFSLCCYYTYGSYKYTAIDIVRYTTCINEQSLPAEQESEWGQNQRKRTKECKRDANVSKLEWHVILICIRIMLRVNVSMFMCFIFTTLISLDFVSSLLLLFVLFSHRR